jgi:hypothetical protein
LGVRTTILEVTLVLIVHETVRDTDRSASISDSITELVDRLSLVETSEAEVIVWSVDGDVLVLELVECRHELLEVFFATLLAHELGREVAVHSGAVPVHILAQRLAVELHIDAVLLADSHENIAGEPDFVGGFLGALTEDLEFPLTLGHLGIDTLMVDSHLEADIKVLLDDVAGDITDCVEADSAVEPALPFGGEAALGEAKRCAILIKEILLLESEPSVRVVENRGAGI